jgi:endonuclease VIII
MPEGPSIVILKEAVQKFKGKKILEANGNTTKIDKDKLVNQKVVDFKSWGKHFLICLPKYTLRIHFLLFGSSSVDEPIITRKPRLHLTFSNGDLYLYACSVLELDKDLNDIYDWSTDVMNDAWDAKKARKKLKDQPDTLVCDAILDQNIFAGSGNIFKNEVLWRIKVHPLSNIGALPPKKLTELINETHNYSFDFLTWKKAYVLKKNWKAHTKKTCPRCDIPFAKEYLGKTKRRTFYCVSCQGLYGEMPKPAKKRATRTATPR